MSKILPNSRPYYLRLGKRVFFNVGEPLKIEPVLDQVRDLKSVEKRKILTDFVQEKLDALRIETLELRKNEDK